jgi:hypothetical protein
MVKVCGVVVAMLQGHSWVPVPSKGSGVNVGTAVVVPEPVSGLLPGGVGASHADAAVAGRRTVVVRGRESRSRRRGPVCLQP